MSAISLATSAKAMAVYQRGTALLTVEKDGDGDSSSSLYCSIICLSGIAKDNWGGLDWLHESTTGLAAYCDWLPPQCHKMKHGDKLTFKVNFEQSFWRGDGYTTDDDEELVFYNERVLKRVLGKNESRKRKKKFYQPKSKLKYGGKVKPSRKQERQFELGGVYLW
jgi:hypothetical protein